MNAIILAAGLGTRLYPYTCNCPKSLVPIHGEPIIERQICFLKEAGIEQITIVVGYYAEQFQYLVERYSVQLVYNPEFKNYNNLYSLYLAKNYLNNTYILEADVYLKENIFLQHLPDKKACYFAIARNIESEEWVLNFDENRQVYSIDIKVPTNVEYTMSGISYWTYTESNKLKCLLSNTIEQNDSFEQKYWDDVVKKHIEEFELYIQPLKPTVCYEIDTVSELHALEGLID